jgi:hypothetical protein
MAAAPGKYGTGESGNERGDASQKIAGLAESQRTKCPASGLFLELNHEKYRYRGLRV